MDTGLSPSDPTVEAAFRAALLHQGLIALGALALLWLVWGTSRNWVSGTAGGGTALPEPRGRRVLRIGFGVLWLFDGLLQAQPQMAAGLPSQVIAPAAQGSPSWVLDLVNWGGSGWAYHPVQAAAAAVWVQVGIGLWLLFAPRGRWSRFAGVASVAWGLTVWVFGEAFGAMFAPGASWLTGAPGAALLYVVAGIFVALPFAAWRGRLPGRVLFGATGLFLLGMALMQAWPGNGFWRGGSRGPLASMAAAMAQIPQPHVFARLVAHFGTFTAGNAFAVNLVVVVALAAAGLAFGALAFAAGAPAGLTARMVRFGRIAVLAGAVFCLAVWVLFQDFGFFGGLGTDPNSMIPTILLFAAAYAAAAPQPASAAAPESAAATAPAAPAAAEPAVAESAASATAAEVPVVPAVGQEPAWQRALAAVSLNSVAAFGALAIVALGAVPMAAASANRTADPIIAEALAGYSPPLREPAPDFGLTNQDGQPASLTGFRGKVVLLTFLDPVCTTDCTFMGQEFLRAGELLAADRSRVELVGVVVNPVYYSKAVVRAYDQQEGLSALPNWVYLTGSLAELEKAWKAYGIVGESLPAGAMIAHNDLAYVIDQSGQIRQEVDFDPGPGTSASVASFASLIADDAHQLLGAS
jgi:cytochrome oxidase Cu insertion factor (SCO1/SenC/PrrC family)